MDGWTDMYSTLDDLKKRLPGEIIRQLTDDENLGQINTSRHAECVAAADAEIDAYLEAGGYTVPLAPVPALIKGISVDITIYRLYQRWSEDIPDTRRTAYKDALRVLESIRDGKMPLPGPEEDKGPTGFGMAVVTTSRFDTAS